MNDFKRNIAIGLMFLIGILGFIAGEFVVSTVMFAAATIFTNIAVNRSLQS